MSWLEASFSTALLALASHGELRRELGAGLAVLPQLAPQRTVCDPANVAEDPEESASEVSSRPGDSEYGGPQPGHEAEASQQTIHSDQFRAEWRVAYARLLQSWTTST